MEKFKSLMRGLGGAIHFILKVTNMFIAGVVLLVAALFLYAAVMGGVDGGDVPVGQGGREFAEAPAPVQMTPADQLDIRTSTTDPTLSADQRRDRMLRSVVMVRSGDSLGSGIVVDNQQCLVVTNAHVVDSAGDLFVNAIVRFRDNGEYVTRRIDAEVVGRPTGSDDLALIKLNDCADLPYAPLGNSDQLRSGDVVVAIGHPRSLGWSVTEGIVSNPARFLGGHSDFSGYPLIQTDAAINPGNSGGGLFVEDGHLVGVNSMILRESDNLGFARSGNLVAAYMDRLEAAGRVTPRALGITVSDDGGTTGLKIDEVAAEGRAAANGFAAGDVILEVNGRRVDGIASMKREVYADADGIVSFKVQRGNTTLDLSINFS